MDIRDRIKGSFIGLCFGAGVNPRIPIYDSGKLRMPSMNTPEEARAKYRNKSFDEIPRDYKLYDNYTQPVMICEMLFRYGEVTPEIFKDYLLELHKKYDVFKGDVYGPSTQRAINGILAGEDIYQMGRKGITCGSAMRSLPIAMYFYNDEEKLIKNTVGANIVSHNTDVAIDAAIACNITLASLLKGKEKFDAINDGIAAAKKCHGKFGEKTAEPMINEKIKDAVISVKGKTLEEAMYIIPEKAGVSWFARETIPGAYANYAVTDTPEGSSLLSMYCGGDTQTVPEIACAFMGAEKGDGIFSEKIISKIEKANTVKIYEMAEKLAERA